MQNGSLKVITKKCKKCGIGVSALNVDNEEHNIYCNMCMSCKCEYSHETVRFDRGDYLKHCNTLSPILKRDNKLICLNHYKYHLTFCKNCNCKVNTRLYKDGWAYCRTCLPDIKIKRDSMILLILKHNNIHGEFLKVVYETVNEDHEFPIRYWKMYYDSGK